MLRQAVRPVEVVRIRDDTPERQAQITLCLDERLVAEAFLELACKSTLNEHVLGNRFCSYVVNIDLERGDCRDEGLLEENALDREDELLNNRLELLDPWSELSFQLLSGSLEFHCIQGGEALF